MTTLNSTDALAEYAATEGITTRGALCTVLFLTRRARTKGLPANPEELLTRSGGQVAGLGRAAVQTILADYGISEVLAQEGGRTSQGGIHTALRYAEFLGQNPNLDLAAVERWWVARIPASGSREQPLRLRYSRSKSLRYAFRELFSQAEERDRRKPGSRCADRVLLHLISAVLSVRLETPSFELSGWSNAGTSGDPDYDLCIGTAAIHCTAAPGEALMRECGGNLSHGLRPIIVSYGRGAVLAEVLAEQSGIADQIDILEADQFVAAYLYERMEFDGSEGRTCIDELILKYNEIAKANAEICVSMIA